jgi:hypothetical protein
VALEGGGLSSINVVILRYERTKGNNNRPMHVGGEKWRVKSVCGSSCHEGDATRSIGCKVGPIVSRLLDACGSIQCLRLRLRLMLRLRLSEHCGVRGISRVSLRQTKVDRTSGPFSQPLRRHDLKQISFSSLGIFIRASSKNHVAVPSSIPKILYKIVLST